MMQMMMIAMMGDRVMKRKRDNCGGDGRDGEKYVVKSIIGEVK